MFRNPMCNEAAILSKRNQQEHKDLPSQYPPIGVKEVLDLPSLDQNCLLGGKTPESRQVLCNSLR